VLLRRPLIVLPALTLSAASLLVIDPLSAARPLRMQPRTFPPPALSPPPPPPPPPPLIPSVRGQACAASGAALAADPCTRMPCVIETAQASALRRAFSLPLPGQPPARTACRRPARTLSVAALSGGGYAEPRSGSISTPGLSAPLGSSAAFAARRPNANGSGR